jgi:hypothetical protein
LRKQHFSKELREQARHTWGNRELEERARTRWGGVAGGIV